MESVTRLPSKFSWLSSLMREVVELPTICRAGALADIYQVLDMVYRHQALQVTPKHLEPHRIR